VAVPAAAEETRQAAAGGTTGDVKTETDTTWVLGIARFSGEDLPLEAIPLADVVPRLMAAGLVALPPRFRPEAEAREALAMDAERQRFASGAELANLLDERANSFLDPSLSPPARKTEIASADKKVLEASRKLEGLLPKEEANPAAPQPPGAALGGKKPEPQKPALWEGNGRGELIEAVELPASTAKAKNLDFLVYGSVSMVSEYALVRVFGYDSSLGKIVFTWKGFCAPDDPAPLALDFAHRVERWVAGRDFARLDIAVEPRSARVCVDGQLLSGDKLVVYRFEPGPVLVEAAAVGYSAASTHEELALGERRSVSVSLSPAMFGSADIRADPPDATILVDSVPAGSSPLELPLSGRREIVTAYAPGRERETVVLPASGNVAVDLDLKIDDGLGPSGRISAAKDDFFKALGWAFLSLPVSSLAVGINSISAEAATRTADPGLVSAYSASQIARGAAIATTAALTINAVIRLVRYLKMVR
jgi:hypothetical protein